jgi:hypothetical protein
MSFSNYYHASKLLACIGMVHMLLILFYSYKYPFSCPEPFLRAVRRGALAKSITGYHKNIVRKQYPVLELANQSDASSEYGCGQSMNKTVLELPGNDIVTLATKLEVFFNASHHVQSVCKI